MIPCAVNWGGRSVVLIGNCFSSVQFDCVRSCPIFDHLGKGEIWLVVVFRAWGHKELLLRTGQLLSKTGGSDGINCTWLSFVVDNTRICLRFLGKEENCTFVESSFFWVLDGGDWN